MLNFDEARGASVADFNLDGKLDVLIINRHANVRLFRNVSPKLGHFINLRLDNSGRNHDGIGAWIEVTHHGKVMRREITVGGGHASGQLGFWHFGLGEDPDAFIHVIWPDGTESDWQDIDADKFYVLSKGKITEVLK